MSAETKALAGAISHRFLAGVWDSPFHGSYPEPTYPEIAAHRALELQ
jgi:hypothetical protein